MLSCRRWSAGCVVAVMLVGAWGCGPSEPEIEKGKVTGNVTLDGQKVTGGRIIFFNASGFGVDAAITPEGTYEVETAVGDTEVFINHREPDIESPGGRGMPMPGKSLVPEKYANSLTSGLKLTVQGGDNKFDIEMVTEK